MRDSLRWFGKSPMHSLPAVILVLLFVSSCGTPKPTRTEAREPADWIFEGGTIWTGNRHIPRAEAIAVRGDRIVEVGPHEIVGRWRGPATRVIDLGKRMLVPGFIDTHIHFASAARFLEFNIMQCATQDEFVARVRDVVGRLEDGEWILGGFWGAYDAWQKDSAGGQGRKPFVPDMSRIAELTRANPMLIRKFDNSEFAINAAALSSLRLDPEKSQVRGIEFVRDDTGTFRGILRGPGARRLADSRNVGRFSRTRRIQQTKHALERIARHGVTTVHDMSDDTQLSIFRELRQRGELTARIDWRYPLDRWKDAVAAGRGDKWIRFGALKGHIDGIMGTSSARFFEPYDNQPENRGRWRKLMVRENGEFAPGKFLRYMLDADRAGLQLTVHAIGDEANHVLLNYLAELERANGPRDRRFRLVHAQVVAPFDMPRLGQMGVLAEVQPFHLSDDMRWMQERIGKERCKGAYAFASIRENGAMLCFGSDWPGTSASAYPINPLLALHAAVTRKTLSGKPEGGWFPDERIGIEDALRAHTVHGAYANFEEEHKGTIAPGMLADIAVLSADLLTCPADRIQHVEVVLTMVGGRVVWEQQASR